MCVRNEVMDDMDVMMGDVCESVGDDCLCNDVCEKEKR